MGSASDMKHSDERRFGPLRQVSDKKWTMDYSYGPGHHATTEWTHPPTVEELDAVFNCEMPSMVEGEKLHGRRWLVGPFTLFFFKDTGPPRWWLPRFRIRFGHGEYVELRIGWNFTALSWSIGRR